MSFHAVHRWSLCDLVRAYLELAVAYFLLCISASVFFPLKFLEVFGLYLPCPCNKYFGFQDSNLCLDNLLSNWPTRNIHSVLSLVKSKFPFDLILFKDHTCNPSRNLIRESNSGSGLLQLEDNACSACSDKERGRDAKRKRILSLRQRTRVQSRRRAALANGNSSPVLLNDISHTNVKAFGCFPDEGNRREDEVMESAPLKWREDYNRDDEMRTWHGFESVSPIDESEVVDKSLSSLEKYADNAKAKDVIGNEGSAVRKLEQALKEEKAARVALYLELEKERAAAATAADEAMAMISRLQTDKASIEMQAKQYQRMIEEKFAYDEEEIDILREILIKREMDNHFLEKEVEAYRQMDSPAKEQSKPSSSVKLIADVPKVQLIENGKSSLKESYSNGSYEFPFIGQNMDNVSNNLHYSILDVDADVQDIHVIEDKTGSSKEDKSSLDSSGSLPALCKTGCSTLHYDSGLNSFSAVAADSLKFDSEVEKLIESKQRKSTSTFPR